MMSDNIVGNATTTPSWTISNRSFAPSTDGTVVTGDWSIALFAGNFTCENNQQCTDN